MTHLVQNCFIFLQNLIFKKLKKQIFNNNKKNRLSNYARINVYLIFCIQNNLTIYKIEIVIFHYIE